MNDWNIQSRAHGCQACEARFADKQKYHTVLTDEKRDYVRLDLCESCWQSQFAEGAKERKGFISYWQGVYEAPAAAPPEPIQKDTADVLLRRLIELNNPRHAAASYILAVMLERKRQLRVKEQFIRDGKRIFIYEQPKTSDLFTIPDPDLQLNQLEQVQQQVADLMEFGLDENGEIIRAPIAPVGRGSSEVEQAVAVDGEDLDSHAQEDSSEEDDDEADQEEYDDDDDEDDEDEFDEVDDEDDEDIDDDEGDVPEDRRSVAN